MKVHKIHLLPKKRPRGNPQLIEQDIKDYHWARFKHVMEFLKQRASLKKPLPKH
jgi:hypothetical protein